MNFVLFRFFFVCAKNHPFCDLAHVCLYELFADDAHAGSILVFLYTIQTAARYIACYAWRVNGAYWERVLYFIKSLKNLCGIATTLLFYVSRIAQHDSIYIDDDDDVAIHTAKLPYIYYHINMGVEVTMISSLFELMWPIGTFCPGGVVRVWYQIEWNELPLWRNQYKE